MAAKTIAAFNVSAFLKLQVSSKFRQRFQQLVLSTHHVITATPITKFQQQIYLEADHQQVEGSGSRCSRNKSVAASIAADMGDF